MGSDWKTNALKALDTYEKREAAKTEEQRLDRERRREGSRNNCRKYLALLLGIDPLLLPAGKFADQYGVTQPEPSGHDSFWEAEYDGLTWRIDTSSAQTLASRDKPPTSWSGVRVSHDKITWSAIAGLVALGRYIKKNRVT
jgi:hypothetical protein